MTLRTSLAVLLVLSFSSPAFAQSALNSKASMGNRGNTNGNDTRGNFYGKARKTKNQGQRLGLRPTSSSSPMKGGGSAPGNIALMQQGQSSLQPTRLQGFVKASGMNDAIYGGDGELKPKYFTFDQSHRIEVGMQSMSDLTTKHKISGPSAWDFPQ